MKLFTITEQYEVELNKEWIMMVPELSAVLKADKGSPKDYRGEKKLKARRQLAFIYFMLDFTSPIREWDEIDRRGEAMRYCSLEEEDIDEVVMAAYDKYEELLELSSRSLKTLKALKAGMDNLDNYFRDVDFEKRDKQGKAAYTAESFITNITKLPKMNSAIQEYERQVQQELKEATGIQGKKTLGGKEGKRASNAWHEGGPPAGDYDTPIDDKVDLMMKDSGGFEEDEEEDDG